MIRAAFISIFTALSIFRGQAQAVAGRSDPDMATDLGGMLRVLSQQADLTTFLGLVNKYPHCLHGIEKNPFLTIIAPSDDAFEKEPALDLTNATLMTELLRYHILQYQVDVKRLAVGSPLYAKTLLTNSSWATVTDGERVIMIRQIQDDVVIVSGGDTRSMIERPNIPFHGGLIQVVDTVLRPPQTLSLIVPLWFPELQAFLGALYETGLTDTIATQDVTVFAPRNGAFQRATGALAALSPADLRGVLAYHIVPSHVLYNGQLQNGSHWATLAGGNEKKLEVALTIEGNNRYVDSSEILDPDILIANGVVHMIADVLNPRQPNVRPIPSLTVQPPVWDLRGNTSTGTRVPTPFISALPCTSDCPVTTTRERVRTTKRVKKPTSTGGGCPAGVGPTGLAAAVAVVGIGLLGMW